MDNLTAVVPFWNGHATIEKLLDSLPGDLPIVIVDDQSPTPLPDMDRPNVQIIRSGKRGYFSGAVNLGVSACETDVLLLNQDVWLEGEAWRDWVAQKRDNFALIADRAGKHPAWPNGYGQGTFMFMRRDAIDAVGGFNEKDYPLWGSTCEWQLRAIRQGFRVSLLTPPWLHHDGRRGDGPRRRLGSAITEAIKQEPRKRNLFLRTPPAVSVIMPSYNYGHYLRDAIHSLIGGATCLGDMDGQTLQSFEIIIVDDASTDAESRKLAEEWENPWQGIRFVQLPKNKGTPGAINEGIKRAYGRFIHILSADDMREPWALERLYRACLKHPHRVAYGNIHAFKDGKRHHPLRLAEYNFDALLKRNMMPAGIMFPKKAWQDVGGYPEEMVHGREDWAFNIRLGIYGWCGVHVGDSGNLCRRDGQNRSVKTATAEYWSLFRQQLQNLFPDIYQGVRPMNCCGGPRNTPRRGGRGGNIMGGAIPNNPGEAMVPIQYVGSASSDFTWHGAVSKKPYTFGGVTRYGYVDPRDLATGNSTNKGFLEMTEGHRRLFQQVDKIPNPNRRKKKTQPNPEPVIEPEEGDDLTVIQGVGKQKAAKLQEAGFTTVQSIVDAVPGALVDRAGFTLKSANKIWEAANALID